MKMYLLMSYPKTIGADLTNLNLQVFKTSTNANLINILRA